MEFFHTLVYTHVNKLFAFLLIIFVLSVYFEGPATELKRVEELFPTLQFWQLRSDNLGHPT